MKTRVLVEFEIEGDPHDAFVVVDGLLDNGVPQDSINDHGFEHCGELLVTAAAVSTLEDDLREILWPKDNPGAAWSADTLDAIAQRLGRPGG